MKKKLLLLTLFTALSYNSRAQTLSNAQWVGAVVSTDTQFSVSVDFTGITSDNTMEWQIKTASESGGVDFSSATIAYGTGIAFTSIGSGSQIITLNLGSGGGSPTITDGQEIIWFGKLSDSNGEVMTLTSPVFEVGASASPNLSNAQWLGDVAAIDTEFSVTVDYSGITSENTMEWQIKTASESGGVDFSSTTIAYGTGITFTSIGSGSQTITLNLGSGGGSPTITNGQEIIWFGKLNDSNGEVMTLTSNVISIGNTASLEHINTEDIVMYPNPVKDNLYFKSNLIKANTFLIFDILGKKVKEFNNVQNLNSIDLSLLNKGVYILKTDSNKQFRFLKE